MAVMNGKAFGGRLSQRRDASEMVADISDRRQLGRPVGQDVLRSSQNLGYRRHLRATMPRSHPAVDRRRRPSTTLVIVTDRTWSTTITRGPLTMTNMLFEPATYAVPPDGNQRSARTNRPSSGPSPVSLDTGPQWPTPIRTATSSLPLPRSPFPLLPSPSAPTSWPRRQAAAGRSAQSPCTSATWTTHS